MKTALCFLLLCIANLSAYRLPQLQSWDHDPARRLINTTSDIIQHTDRQVALLNGIRKTHSGNAAFEIGYLSFVLQEKYRRMVDRYNVSVTKRSSLYLMEHVLFLKEIEQLYWDVQHLSNMLHEVERKYNITSPMDVEYVEETTLAEGQFVSMPAEMKNWRATKRKRYRQRKHKSQAWVDLEAAPPRPQNQNKWWPIDYGWEIDYYWYLRSCPFEKYPHICRLQYLRSPLVSKYPHRLSPGGLVTCYLDFKEQHNSDVGMKRMVRLMMDYAHKARLAVDEANRLRAEHEATPHFELGYVMSELLDRYRKMVETARHPLDYNLDTVIDTLRATELVQRLFFEIYHLVNIIHEIPKKYGRMDEFANQAGYDPSKIADTEKRLAMLERERRRRKRQWLKEMTRMQALGQLANISQGGPARPGNKWWPIDYGWEIDYYW